jgi:hypothetical protein
MKKLTGIILALAALLPAMALAQSLAAPLAGGAGLDPDGVGFAALSVNGNVVTYSILVNNLATVSAAHIHRAADASVAVTFNPPLFGTVTVDSGLLAEILATPSAFYVNVHTSEFPNGAIRGALAAESAADPGETVSFVPDAGKVAGAAGTNYVTDVRIANTSGAAAAVTIEWWPANGTAGASAPAGTQTVTVAAGEQLVRDDIIGALFNGAGVGTLRFSSTRPVNVYSRIINDQRAANAGTTGVAFQAQGLADAKSAGVLPFLSQASAADQSAGAGFRTNIGYLNPNAFPVTLTLTAHDTATGAALGSSRLTLQGYAIQGPVNAFQLIAVPEEKRVQPNYYVTYQATAPMFVYATPIDNKTGDFILVQ